MALTGRTKILAFFQMCAVINDLGGIGMKVYWRIQRIISTQLPQKAGLTLNWEMSESLTLILLWAMVSLTSKNWIFEKFTEHLNNFYLIIFTA